MTQLLAHAAREYGTAFKNHVCINFQVRWHAFLRRRVCSALPFLGLALFKKRVLGSVVYALRVATMCIAADFGNGEGLHMALYQAFAGQVMNMHGGLAAVVAALEDIVLEYCQRYAGVLDIVSSPQHGNWHLDMVFEAAAAVDAGDPWAR